ncbi:hypothetical protein BDN71DRAFT_1504438 [Pleurotus eryngii]|uniref:Uncharacterized protein n=1 Tax=Pleurotus eryngii TaxID=5323 RepID=A0A9P6D9E7_PLEER|nr:hypothetical protein BDN71DRAFT_1504438 [Pleurotus eryngii]
MASPHPSQADVSDYMDAEDTMDIEEARTPRNWNSAFEAEIIAESGNTSDGYVGNHEDVNHTQDHPMTRQDFIDISQYLGELSSAVHEAAEINKQIFDSLLSEVRMNLNAASPVGESGCRFPAFAGSAGEEAVLLRVFDAIESLLVGTGRSTTKKTTAPPRAKKTMAPPSTKKTTAPPSTWRSQDAFICSSFSLTSSFPFISFFFFTESSLNDGLDADPSVITIE